MRRKLSRFRNWLCLLVIAQIAIANGQDVVEEPIAIVADRVILRSEWETQLSLHSMQANVDANDPLVRDTLGQVILDQMINDQLILLVAEQDSTLMVSPKELDEAVEEHILSLRRRYPTDDQFHRDLAQEGLTERDLRVRFRQDINNQLLKQKLMQRKLSDVAVSHGEVREFYSHYSDSLPVRPAGIKLAHILLPVDVSESVVDATRERLTRILGEIRDGLDFGEAARKYSADASAPNGGDLGWFGKGEMVAEFEQAAFALTPGQTSGVLRTPFGWHLIQCIERTAERVHARHVILTLEPTGADSAAVRARADSAAALSLSGEDFCLLAQEYSKDEETRKNCGELGWYPIEEMFEEFKTVLADAGNGAIAGPVMTKYGWHVLRVLDRRPAHRLNLTDDWDAIKQIARQDKTNRVLTDWIAEVREDTYVDIRPLSARRTLTPSSP
ncbi:MAG TPA: peptidylprolyl isomerase [candidate division Zixibacteria bacterium]|jgi:peptidyl-prolyl cis-trans isomerase SurA